MLKTFRLRSILLLVPVIVVPSGGPRAQAQAPEPPCTTGVPCSSPLQADPATTVVVDFGSAYRGRVRDLFAARNVEWNDATRLPEGRDLDATRLALVDATVRVVVPGILDAIADCRECQRTAAELRMLPDLRSRTRMARFRQAALVARDGHTREDAPNAWFRWLHNALADAADAATDDIAPIESTATRIARPIETGLTARSDATVTAALVTRGLSEVASWDGATPADFAPLAPTYITADDVARGHRYADRARAVACDRVRPYLAVVIEQLPASTATERDRIADFGYRALDGLVRVVLAEYLDGLGLGESARRLRALTAIDGPRSAQAAAQFFESGAIRVEVDRMGGTEAQLRAVFRVVDPVANTITPPSIWSRSSQADDALRVVMEERLPEVTRVLAVTAGNPVAQYRAIVEVYARLLGAR